MVLHSRRLDVVVGMSRVARTSSQRNIRKAGIMMLLAVLVSLLSLPTLVTARATESEKGNFENLTGVPRVALSDISAEKNGECAPLAE